MPAVDRLRKIGEDEGFKRKGPDDAEEVIKYWKIKVIGDQMQYQKEGNNVTYATILINNTRWPGSATVWKVSL